MRRALLLLCAGIAIATFVVDVPLALKLALHSLAASASLLLLCKFSNLKSPLKRGFSQLFIAALLFLAGVVWHLEWAYTGLNKRLPESLEGTTLEVEGIVTGLPERSLIAQQFQFQILQGPTSFSPRKIVLNYYGDAVIQPGQYWRFAVRLNRVHGFSNPGGFDYEGWLFQQGISARGYVRNSPAKQLLDAPRIGFRAAALVQLHSLRYSLKVKLEEVLEGAPYGGLLIALILGDRSAVSQDNWQLFTATGSNHLFVISGLHIGMITGFVLWVALSAGKIAGIGRYLPAQKFAALFALVAGFVYALLAGFSLPTQRAFIMIAVLICSLFWNTRYPMSFRLVVALLAVLLLNPLAASSSGFWLSFTAVGALLAFADSSRSPPLNEESGRTYRETLINVVPVFVRPQIIVFVALAVPLIFFTQQLSLIAPLVNIIAIPLVGFLVVPLCFIALLLSYLHLPTAAVLLAIAHEIVHWLLSLMSLLVSWGSGIVQLHIPQLTSVQLFALSIAALLLLMPTGVCRKSLALPLLLCILPMPSWLSTEGEKVDALRLLVVDVGQGLAVIVQTKNHTLLYDTGANLSPDFNIGSAVLVPTLRAFKISALDAVVVSHADNDHAGGLRGVEGNIPIRNLISNRQGLRSDLPLSLCSATNDWNWDGVEFRFLKTGLDSPSENNSSCVLQIRSGAVSILLPGDIERQAELELALRYGSDLASTVLLAPHHGSSSSSSYAFLKRVEPRYVVFSAGYRNSFGHPHERVLERYAEFSSETFFTFESGMISFEFSEVGVQQGKIANIHKYREQKSRYWY